MDKYLNVGFATMLNYKPFLALILFIGITQSDTTGRNSKPHIIFFIGDDIGHNDVQWNNPRISTPNLNKMAQDGIILQNFYTYSLCTPSRASFLTGMFAQELGLQRGSIEPQEPSGIPTNVKLLSEVLQKQAKYRTHAIGKWNLGFCDKKYTPVYRGFDTFFGFWQPFEDNYMHCLSSVSEYNPVKNCAFDLRDNMTDVHEQYMGKYSTTIYNDRAVKIIENHPKNEPLFMYISLTSTHVPVQAPEHFLKNCNLELPQRKVMCGALNSVDSAFVNVTNALKKTGLFNNSIIIFVSDNGAHYDFGGSNFPLRGNKGSLYEGGTRVPGFIYSPLLNNIKYNYTGLFHMVDWFPTFMYLAQIKPSLVKSLKLQGVNQWESLSEKKDSPRTEFPYTVDYINGTIIGAIRKENYKLIVGPGGTGDEYRRENETVDMSFNATFLHLYQLHVVSYNLSDTVPKLYDLSVDPEEKCNLATQHPEKVKELWLRFQYYLYISKPAIKLNADSKGNPGNFGNVFETGWCKPFKTVPEY